MGSKFSALLYLIPKRDITANFRLKPLLCHIEAVYYLGIYFEVGSSIFTGCLIEHCIASPAHEQLLGLLMTNNVIRVQLRNFTLEMTRNLNSSLLCTSLVLTV
jgi:hypothetical protein